MRRRRDRICLLLILLASFAFRLHFINDDMADLVTQGPLYDDSFYCFGVARNIANGHGSTFDGMNPTNGYQPLYVALLVPLYWISGSNANLPVYLALGVSAILNVLTGLILFRLVLRFTSFVAAVFALVLWGFGPAIVRQALNGLETSLAMFFIAASLDYYVCVYRNLRRPAWRQSATMGCLLAFAVLARIDAVLFVAALFIDAAVLAHRRGSLRSLLRVFAVSSLLLLPWAAVSQAQFGAPIPKSGQATRFLSEAYAPHDIPSVAELSFENGPPLEFFANNFRRSLMLMGTSPVVHIFTRGVEKMALANSIDGRSAPFFVGSFLAVLVLAGVFVVHWQTKRQRHDSMPSHFNFLYVYALFLVASYSLVVFGQIFYSRYYYPIFFFSIVLGAFAFDVLLSLVGNPGSRRRSVIGIAIVLVYLATLPYMSMHRLKNGNYQFYNVVEWIDQNTDSASRIGSFNCGAIGYYSDREVFNLDGKVNSDALRALRSDRLHTYLASQRVDYVIDHEWILQRFLLDTPERPQLRLVQVASPKDLGVPGWRAYRVYHQDPPYDTVALPQR